MTQAKFSHLENIDPRYLEADASFVVMTESAELDLSEAHLALDALSWICEGMVSQNIALKAAERGTTFLQVPPDSMAALLRIVGEKIKPAINSPTLGAMQCVRPDLFNRCAGGSK
ncbi:MAG: hypothetical protein ACKVOO_12330 [Burkholderiaceae bacterium]